jgi:hypothetical protein
VVSSRQFFRLVFCRKFSSPPSMIHVSPIWSSFIRSWDKNKLFSSSLYIFLHPPPPRYLLSLRKCTNKKLYFRLMNIRTNKG